MLKATPLCTWRRERIACFRCGSLALFRDWRRLDARPRFDDVSAEFDPGNCEQIVFLNTGARTERNDARRAAFPVRLQTREKSQGRAESASAANTAWTVPVGTSLLIRMIDSIDSETDAVDKVFIARLGCSSAERRPCTGGGRAWTGTDPNCDQRHFVCT